MKLNESDRLSLLALIVAVVALIVSAWQLAQQLFATATDGKRFCQASVMGVWARKTRLSWRWSQIRFETKYTTPEIRFSSAIGQNGTHGSTTADRKASIWYRVPVIRWIAEVSLGPSSDWNGFFEVTTDRSNAPLELRKTRPPGLSISTNSSAERWSLWFLSWWDGSYQSDNPDVVSWPKLLERTYVNQTHSVQKARAKRSNGALANTTNGQLELGEAGYENLPPCADLQEFERQGEDRVVVRLVERSWDLVPPDVVRPLAQSTVGTMITLANRLGVSWQGNFDPNQGDMNAFGCGHTITSESVRGLGLVVKYTFHEESRKVRNATGARRGVGHGEYLSPTQTADKLHCGAVPVDHTAISQGLSVPDIHLIGSDRKFDMNGFLNRLKMSSTEADQLKESKHTNQHGSPLRAFKHAIEDAVSMLCPIPTQPDSLARCITWPFRTLRQPFTTTRQTHGLAALIELLSVYVQSHKPHARVMEDRENSILKPLDSGPESLLRELLEKLTQIEKYRKTPNALSKHQDDLARIYARVQQIHRQTSDVFASISLPADNVEEDEDHIPFLMVIVAAHVTLATKYGKKADRTAIANDDALPEGSKQSSNDNRKGFVKELARLYIEDLGNDKVVRKHIRSHGYTNLLEPGVIPSLWWTLVVRSACWWISVRVKLPETQIPSYWYYSQTPIYIT